ncbi:MAG: BACON domain-containing protein, partial [Alistipes sp.]|nr:BACON domain-containing protein [Alistipes sp.]
MKRLLLLFALVAFAACQTETPEPQPQPEPQPEVKEPKLTLTSEATLEFEATGGEGIITYTLENSVEGTELEAECMAEWVTDLTIGENVTFSVAANDVEQVRQTTISVTYGELGFEVLVKQAAKEAEPEPEPEPEYTEL